MYCTNYHTITDNKYKIYTYTHGYEWNNVYKKENIFSLNYLVNNFLYHSKLSTTYSQLLKSHNVLFIKQLNNTFNDLCSYPQPLILLLIKLIKRK